MVVIGTCCRRPTSACWLVAILASGSVGARRCEPSGSTAWRAAWLSACTAYVPPDCPRLCMDVSLCKRSFIWASPILRVLRHESGTGRHACAHCSVVRRLLAPLLGDCRGGGARGCWPGRWSDALPGEARDNRPRSRRRRLPCRWTTMRIGRLVGFPLSRTRCGLAKLRVGSG